MFNNKTVKPVNTTDTSAKVAAIIGGSDKMHVEGNIFTEVETQIMCPIKGNIESTAGIIVSTSGTINGDIFANEIFVDSGNIIGNLSALKVTLAGNAVVTGDITTDSIVIMEGATFSGRVMRKADVVEQVFTAESSFKKEIEQVVDSEKQDEAKDSMALKNYLPA